jgi:hypothetical protein
MSSVGGLLVGILVCLFGDSLHGLDVAVRGLVEPGECVGITRRSYARRSQAYASRASLPLCVRSLLIKRGGFLTCIVSELFRYVGTVLDTFGETDFGEVGRIQIRATARAVFLVDCPVLGGVERWSLRP